MTTPLFRPQWDPPEPAWRLLGPLVALGVHVLVRLRVNGAGLLPRHGPVIVAANHLSHLDPLVLLVALLRLGRRARFLAGVGAFDHAFAGPFLRVGQMIPVAAGQGEFALTAAERALLSGELVAVYPEGTIPPPGEQVALRPGVGRLALRTGAPVIPTSLWGLQRGPSGRYRPGLRRPAAVVFHPPLQWAPQPPQAIDEAVAASATAQIMDAVQAGLPRARRLAGE